MTAALRLDEKRSRGWSRLRSCPLHDAAVNYFLSWRCIEPRWDSWLG